MQSQKPALRFKEHLETRFRRYPPGLLLFLGELSMSPRSSLSQLCIIAGALLVSTVVRYTLCGFMAYHLPYSIYFIAVIVVAWSCGWKAALMTLAASCVFGTQLFTLSNMQLDSPESWSLFFFTFNSLISIALTESLRVAQNKAKNIGTDLIEQQHETACLLKQTQVLARLGEVALIVRDQHILFEEATTHLSQVLHTHYTSVLKVMPDTDEMLLVSGDGWPDNMVGNTKIGNSSEFQAGFTLLSGEPVIVEDFDQEERFTASDPLRERGIKSGMTVVIPGKDRPWGVLGVYCTRIRSYTNHEVALLQAVANVLAAVTNRKTLEDQLRLRINELAVADRRKDEFMAMLAHELRNPLAPIQNCTSILGMDVDKETVQWALDTMHRQVQHMVRLVDDLLDVSRSMRGRIDLKKEVQDLQSILFRAIETSKPVIEAQGHRFTFLQSQKAIYIDVDEIRMAQVISNLLNNAAKFTSFNGTIQLASELVEGDKVAIIITDNGCGIERDLLPHIFDPFTQADRSLDRSKGGLGIGLALVKSLVEMHDGEVSVESVIGAGSRFTVTLPVSKQSHTSDEIPAINKLGHLSRRIMVVDDNADAARTLSAMLRLDGHHSMFVFSGAAALDKVEEFQPDIILLDIGLPEMNGYEVCQRLRQISCCQAICIIALTGYGTPEHRDQAFQAGFSEHLVKPVQYNLLQTLFDRVCHPN